MEAGVEAEMEAELEVEAEVEAEVKAEDKEAQNETVAKREFREESSGVYIYPDAIYVFHFIFQIRE